MSAFSPFDIFREDVKAERTADEKERDRAAWRKSWKLERHKHALAMREIGVRLLAFAEGEWVATKLLRLAGYDPHLAGMALISLSMFEQKDGEPPDKQVSDAESTMDALKDALRLPNWSKGVNDLERTEDSRLRTAPLDDD
jgi:hypothetical protein